MALPKATERTVDASIARRKVDEKTGRMRGRVMSGGFRGVGGRPALDAAELEGLLVAAGTNVAGGAQITGWAQNHAGWLQPQGFVQEGEQAERGEGGDRGERGVPQV